MSERSYMRGGEFLLKSLTSEELFTPEDLSSDQRMYAKTARDFMEKEIIPISDEIEKGSGELNRKTMAQAGELGLLMGDVPEEHGGMGLDKRSCSVIIENLSGQGSFMTTYLAHTGIGTLPIVYYGTSEHKEKYLPGLASGELIGAYCLTEPSAGSDALSCRTRAVLSSDGEYYLINGTKQFITNAEFGDVLTVFAKVDGEHFTGFIVDRDSEGVQTGPPEHKMGLKGSITTTVIFEDVKVPVGNVLGTVGGGHKIAFNVLNVGRYKLGLAALGAGKRALDETLAYTLERKQFGKRIADFEAIGEKLAQMYVSLYALESICYRTVGTIDRLLDEAEDKYAEAGLQSLEEYSVECAIVKVVGSEANDYVADEAIQCFGGYGYCSEYPMERYYRDNRVNRIFEGTNEINRIVIGSMLLRKAASGELPLFEAAQSSVTPVISDGGLLADEKALVENLKKVTLQLLSIAAKKHGKALAGEQSILLRIADMVIATYRAESTLLRALKCVEKKGEESSLLAVNAARVICEQAMEEATRLANQCLVAMDDAEGLATLAALSSRNPANTIGGLKAIAAKLIDLERVTF